MKAVIAGHSAAEDARERAYDPAIHPSCEKMDARVNGIPADLVGRVPLPRMTGRTNLPNLTPGVFLWASLRPAAAAQGRRFPAAAAACRPAAQPSRAAWRARSRIRAPAACRRANL